MCRSFSSGLSLSLSLSLQVQAVRACQVVISDRQKTLPATKQTLPCRFPKVLLLYLGPAICTYTVTAFLYHCSTGVYRHPLLPSHPRTRTGWWLDGNCWRMGACARELCLFCLPPCLPACPAPFVAMRLLSNVGCICL